MWSVNVQLKVAEGFIRLGQFVSNQEDMVTYFESLNLFVHPTGDAKIVYRRISGWRLGNKEHLVCNHVKPLLLYLFSTTTFQEGQTLGLANDRKIDRAKRCWLKQLEGVDSFEG